MTRRSVFAFLGTAIAAVASFRPLSALQRRPLARGPLLPGAHAPGSPVVRRRRAGRDRHLEMGDLPGLDRPLARRAATPAGVGAASLPRRRPPLTPDLVKREASTRPKSTRPPYPSGGRDRLTCLIEPLLHCVMRQIDQHPAAKQGRREFSNCLTLIEAVLEDLVRLKLHSGRLVDPPPEELETLHTGDEAGF